MYNACKEKESQQSLVLSLEKESFAGMFGKRKDITNKLLNFFAKKQRGNKFVSRLLQKLASGIILK